MSHRPRTRAWTLLSAAIVAEVVGTMALRAAVDSGGWIPLVVVGYVAAFALLGRTLRVGMPIGVAYSVWGAVGVASTALLGAVLFREFLSPTSIVGIGLIVVGVVLIEGGTSNHQAHQANP